MNKMLGSPARMPRELLLHIGTVETAATSIQRSMAAVRARLAEVGVMVPVSPGRTNHALLALAFCPPSVWQSRHYTIWNGLDPAQRLTLFRRSFVEEMSGIPSHIRRIVITSEALADQLTERSQIKALRDFIAPFADRIRVLVYLRRQDRLFASDSVRILRSGRGVMPPRLPVEGGGPDPVGLAARYDYQQLLARWAEVFGEDALIPRIFEHSSLVDGDPVEDFLAQIGTPGILPKDAPERRVESDVSARGVAFMLAMAAHLQEEGGLTISPRSVDWSRFTKLVSKTMPGPGWTPSAAEARAFLARFAASNDAVRKRWFPDRASLFAEVGDTDGDPLPGASDKTTVEACSLLLAEIDRDAPRVAPDQPRAAMAMLMAEIGRRVPLDLKRACRAATAAEQAGDDALALRRFLAALRADPDAAAGHAGMCRLLARSGQAPAAALHLDALRRVEPDHPQIERLVRLLSEGAEQPRNA